jgi:predicted secreted protein
METKNKPKLITWEELKKQIEEEDSKKNFRNWINNKFPNGYADYNVYYVLFHPWVVIEYWIRHIKYAWQRVFNKYDERVTWSIDWYLTEMLPKWIRELKQNNHGVPMSMFDGMEHDENYNYSEEDGEIATKKWDNILDNIIEGFEAGRKIQEFDEDNEEMIKKFNDGFDLFKKYFFNLWD